MAPLTATATRPGSQGGTGQTTASPDTKAGAIGATVPFTRASTLHRESTQYDNTVAIAAGGSVMPLSIIPAFGFLRALVLKVTIVSTGGTPVFAADGPFNVFNDITLAEPNGATIFSLPSGYSAYLANKYGGYRNSNDPKSWYGYTVSGGNATFFLRVPLEIDVRSALGSLPNQNSSANFQLKASLNALATVYSALPTSATIRVQSWFESWDQPGPDTFGAPNETAPPAMNTTQFWTQTTVPVVVGMQTIKLTRVGNQLRNVGLLFRNATGVRTDLLVAGSQVIFAYDSQPLDYIEQSIWQQSMSERYGYTGVFDTVNALDTGFYNYDFTHDFAGKPGFETRNLWLPTLSSSRLEFQFNASAAGQVQLITNDVVLADNVFMR